MRRLLVALLAAPLLAQNVQIPGLQELRIGGGIQLTGIFTHGTRADLSNSGRLDPVDDRFDLGLRRARLTLSGRILAGLDFRVIFFYDNVGRDRFTGTRGTPSEGSLGIWDAFWTWHARPERLHIIIGYFRPQLGREHITSGFQTNSSMDKLPTQNYQRIHAIGRSNGRETGINAGGLYSRGKWCLNYNAGFFDASHEKLAGQPYGGRRWSPLLAGRLALSIGDPEMKSYSIDYQVNYFGRRRGLTVAAFSSHQGHTDAFQRNSTMGLDLLANYGPLNLDAECSRLARRRLDGAAYADHTWHARAGYNIRAASSWLEPVFAVAHFTGSSLSPWKDGRDEWVDAGLNWYLRETRVKFNLHFTRQSGRPLSGYDDGKIRRGNMVGFGVQFVF